MNSSQEEICNNSRVDSSVLNNTGLTQPKFSYPIGGIRVQFPCKPYSTQMQMMSKIIKALNEKSNALLESPTGTGKSLALLCSTLAWIKTQSEAASVKPVCCCDCHREPSNPRPSSSASATFINTVNISPSITTTTSHVTPSHVISVSKNQNDHVIHQSCSTQCTPSVTNNSNSSLIQAPSVTINSNSSLIQAPSVTNNSNSSLIQAPSVTINSNSSLIQNILPLLAVSQQPPLLPIVPAISQQLILPNRSILLNATFLNQTRSSSAETFGSRELQQNSPSTIEQTPTNSGRDFRPTKTRKEQHQKKKKIPKIEYEEDDQVVLSTSMVTSAMIKNSPCQPTKEMKVSMMDQSPSVGVSIATPTPPCKVCGCDPTQSEPRKKLTKKIFYGTRTHKQIKQITRELARTAYSTVPMTILASREHACIHPEVSRGKNKNEECKKLLEYAEGVSCSFFHKVQQRLNCQSKLRDYGFNEAWDMEDLITLGKKIKVCPYFATRALRDEAEIVFCPYNYLIDPKIRRQMMINLEDQIIIFDEAHNMEDVSRSAASLDTSIVQLNEIKEELVGLVKVVESKESYSMILALVNNIIGWMGTRSESFTQEKHDESFGVWSGNDFIPTLKQLGITCHTQSLILHHLNKIFEDAMESKDKDKEGRRTIPNASLSTGSINTLEALFTVIGYLFNYTNDYRVALKKSATMVYNNQNKNGQWRKRKRGRQFVVSLHLWCLNPAVAFTQLNTAQSIILTSGTLSPMGSFASELGTSFAVQFEANHVINQSQSLIQALSHGPNGHELNGSYRTSGSFEFQDEVGELILRICQTVPYGVLCFLTSYSLMDKLIDRWQNTGIWYQILKRKHTVCESRASDKEDFDIAMTTFYNTIQKAVDGTLQTDTDNPGFCQDGAILFAVCRGKVSEGLDFSDNNARAVITIGIPFPNFTDKQVALKQEYNNEWCHKRDLLTGRDWYSIQAYRALNQALGRCLRHKNDWGALIIVDSRFQEGNRFCQGLSKWVRSRLKHPRTFSEALSALDSFVRDKKPATVSQEDTSITKDQSTISLKHSLTNFTLIAESSDSSQSSDLIPQSVFPCSPVSDSIPPAPFPCSPVSDSTVPFIITTKASKPSIALQSAISVHNNSSYLITDVRSCSPVLFGSETSRSPINKTPEPSNTAVLQTSKKDGCLISDANTNAVITIISSEDSNPESTPPPDDMIDQPNTTPNVTQIVKSTSNQPVNDHKSIDNNASSRAVGNSTTVPHYIIGGPAEENSGPVLRRSNRKHNIRMTNKPNKKELVMQDREEEKDFKTTKKKKGKEQSLKARSSNTCDCGITLTENEAVKCVNIGSLFPNGEGVDSILFDILQLGSIQNDRCYCTQDKSIVDDYKTNNAISSLPFLNAVWDEALGLCYSTWKCGCGQIIGIIVHCSVVPDHPLINMNIMCHRNH